MEHDADASRHEQEPEMLQEAAGEAVEGGTTASPDDEATNKSAMPTTGPGIGRAKAVTATSPASWQTRSTVRWLSMKAVLAANAIPERPAAGAGYSPCRCASGYATIRRPGRQWQCLPTADTGLRQREPLLG
jgi:hypothetical protein